MVLHVTMKFKQSKYFLKKSCVISTQITTKIDIINHCFTFVNLNSLKFSKPIKFPSEYVSLPEIDCTDMHFH